MDSVVGEVVSGAGRGREIGVPTVNLRVEALPESGVYAGFAEGAQAVMSCGASATFGVERATFEVHFLDGVPPLPERVRCVLVKKLREMRKFENGAELAKQIGRDIKEAREVLCRHADIFEEAGGAG